MSDRIAEGAVLSLRAAHILDSLLDDRWVHTQSRVACRAERLDERDRDRALVLEAALRRVVPAALGSLARLDPRDGELQGALDAAPARAPRGHRVGLREGERSEAVAVHAGELVATVGDVARDLGVRIELHPAEQVVDGRCEGSPVGTALWGAAASHPREGGEGGDGERRLLSRASRRQAPVRLLGLLLGEPIEGALDRGAPSLCLARVFAELQALALPRALVLYSE